MAKADATRLSSPEEISTSPMSRRLSGPLCSRIRISTSMLMNWSMQAAAAMIVVTTAMLRCGWLPSATTARS